MVGCLSMGGLVQHCGIGSLARLATHRNPGLEIVFVRRGHLLWQTEGVVESVPPGSVYFTLPEQEHGSAEEFEPGHEWIFVVFAPGRDGPLHPELGFSKTEAREIVSLLRTSRRHSLGGSRAMETWLLSLVEESRSDAPFREGRIAALGRLAVIELVRCAQAHGRQREPLVRSGARERLRSLVAAIAKEPTRDWKVGRMAARCRLGRTRFADLFKAETGDSPVRFLQRMRVREACRLLRETDRPITHIALECGFGTSQYFAHVFKRCTGGSDARSYRREARKSSPR